MFDSLSEQIITLPHANMHFHRTYCANNHTKTQARTVNPGLTVRLKTHVYGLKEIRF
jgi:hypothetical protein